MIEWKIFFHSLKNVLLQENRLHLVFEFLSMDLKKYLDSLPAKQMMDKKLVKVSVIESHLFFFYNFNLFKFRAIYNKLLKG